MTPAALEVLCDAAREGGATEEEVARVRAVVTHRSVWLVIGVCGEYSDRSEWVVAAYFDRALAERHADLASEEEQRLLAAHLSAGGNSRSSYRAQQYPNRYDAKVQRDYTGTDYHAAEVCDLRLSLPESDSGASAPRPRGETP